MKRIISLAFAMVIFLSACTSPVTATSTPVEQVEATFTSQSVENRATATLVPEPTLTSTPVPQSVHWYWAVNSDTERVITVNQFGEQHELGALDQSDDLHTAAISLDHERALLFLDSNDTLRVYLLTPDGMQKIALPSEPFYFNTEAWQPSRAVIAMHADRVVFSYVTEGSSNIMPDRGPIFLVDLKSLKARLIDETVSRGSYSDNRHWFHVSQDGRYMRYLNGDEEKMEIRELDMVTGRARTLYTTQGSSFGIYASPQGDLWYLRSSKLIIDLNGNEANFTDESLTFRPLMDGRGLVYPRDCVDHCAIKVITPFGNDAELIYDLPWTIQSGVSYGEVNRWLPDQSLLFAGESYISLSNTPDTVETYPDLTKEDSPLFRLTPDGEAHLVGIRAGDVSDDGRHMLLRSTDQTSFFIYDIIADRPLFDIPIDTDLVDYFVLSTRFLDNGIVVNLSPSVPGEKNVYRYFYHAYVYETSTSIAWEDVNAEISGCPDLLEDGSVICWFYRTDTSNSDLVRYDPATGIKTPLLENVWLIDFTP
jgi:hypothetical protein